MTFLTAFSILWLAICCIIQSIWLRDHAKRISKLEQIIFIRKWLEAAENGESFSDLAYMKEKGFLK